MSKVESPQEDVKWKWPELNDRFHSSAKDTSLSDRTIFFADRTAVSGINFHYYGSPVVHDMTEQNGGGVALLDYDSDGTLDSFFSNGSQFLRPAESVAASNELHRGIGEFRYQNTTEQSGLRQFNFGQGVAAGDFDNDGFTDLFVATYGRNTLWHNNGDGTFRDVSTAAGLDETRFSTSAAFADLNADGNLDLVVVNYLEWSSDGKLRSRLQSPMDFSGVPDDLYRSMGDGTFNQSSVLPDQSTSDNAKGLALSVVDFNQDGLLDIYVANDTSANMLLKNSGGGKFRDIGITSGAAVSQNGGIGSSMGVAVSDFNHDGRPDLFVTNFSGEPIDALQNLGESGFAASNTELGLDSVTMPLLNFGIIAADFNLDTWPDLFVANGHLWDETPAGGLYRMRPVIFQNERGERFRFVSTAAGSYFAKKWIGRAAAIGDLDNDGDADLVVCHLVDPPSILENSSTRIGKSHRIRFIGTDCCRQPLGCEVRWQVNDGSELITHVPSGGSFQACHDPAVIVSLQKSQTLERISIRWPNGEVESWKGVALNAFTTLRQGTGTTR